MIYKIRDVLKGFHLLYIPVVFCFRILSGYYTYKKILKHCIDREKARIYFVDYSGSGDTYLICSCLESKGLIGPQDIFVAAGSLPAKIASYFPFGEIMQISPKSAFALRRLGRSYSGMLKVIPLLYESEPLRYTGVLRYMQGHRGLNFMSMIWIGFERQLAIPFEENAWRKPELPCDSSELDQIFRELRLEPRRTILIAPYVGKGGTWGIPIRVYEELARRLGELGFCICTNSSDPKREPVIQGTTPIFLPYSLILQFCEKAGGFIGTRSGLCDIISAAQTCKKVIVYPELKTEGPASVRKFFSLKEMGLCDKQLLELVYRENMMESLLEDVLNLFAG